MLRLVKHLLTQAATKRSLPTPSDRLVPQHLPCAFSHFFSTNDQQSDQADNPDFKEMERLVREANKETEQRWKQQQQQQKHPKKPVRSDGYRFVDRIRIQAKGGSGGRGCLSHKSLRKMRLHPDGGHGGAGGSVILMADRSETSLAMSTRHFTAPGGSPGQAQEMAGAIGNNLVLRVPCGVVVKRILETDDEWDETNKRVIPKPNQQPKLELGYLKHFENAPNLDHNGKHIWSLDDPPPSSSSSKQEENEEEVEFDPNNEDTWPKWEEVHEKKEKGKSSKKKQSLSQLGFEPLPTEEFYDDEQLQALAQADAAQERPVVTVADLDQHGSYVVVARGGRGGIGTTAYAHLHGPERPEPLKMSKNAAPELGESARLELELKLIADIGLVGFPNAGKSSLLRAMSRATPKVAPYPFTTLHPKIGTIEYRDGFQLQTADIPGLIDGASEGRGCGHDFLRHIERTKALLYVLDVAGTDGRDPHDDLRVLVHELESYGDGDLLERRAIVLANKTDLMDRDQMPELQQSLGQVADELGLKRDHGVLTASVGVTGDGLGPLSRSMRELVAKVEQDRLELEQLEEAQMMRA